MAKARAHACIIHATWRKLHATCTSSLEQISRGCMHGWPRCGFPSPRSATVHTLHMYVCTLRSMRAPLPRSFARRNPASRRWLAPVRPPARPPQNGPWMHSVCALLRAGGGEQNQSYVSTRRVAGHCVSTSLASSVPYAAGHADGTPQTSA